MRMVLLYFMLLVWSLVFFVCERERSGFKRMLWKIFLTPLLSLFDDCQPFVDNCSSKPNPEPTKLILLLETEEVFHNCRWCSKFGDLRGGKRWFCFTTIFLLCVHVHLGVWVHKRSVRPSSLSSLLPSRCACVQVIYTGFYLMMLKTRNTVLGSLWPLSCAGLGCAFL